MVGRRRPQSLSENALMSEVPAAPATAQGNAVDGEVRDEVQKCVRQLQQELNEALSRHMSALQQRLCVQQLVCSDRPRVHPYECRSADSAQPMHPGMGAMQKSAQQKLLEARSMNDLPLLPGTWPETPKLPPPRNSQTPVLRCKDQLRHIAKNVVEDHGLAVADIDEAPWGEGSDASTRSGSACPQTSASKDTTSSCLTTSPRALTEREKDIEHELREFRGPSHLKERSYSSQKVAPLPPRPPTAGRPSTAWIGSVKEGGDSERSESPDRKLGNESSQTAITVLSESGELPQPEKKSRPRPAPLNDHAGGVGSTGTQLTRKSCTVFSPLSKRNRDMMMQARGAWLKWLTRRREYEVASASLIALNSVFIVWETQRRAYRVSEGGGPEALERSDFFKLASYLFCAVFVSDLILRMAAERSRFFRSHDRAWNALDMFVSANMCVEVFIDWYGGSKGEDGGDTQRLLRRLSMLRMLRIVRLLKFIRVTRNVRIIRFVRELRLMVLSLTGAVKTLIWAAVLMLIVFVVFSITFTDGAVNYLVTQKRETIETQDLRKYFGTLSTSVVTLYMSMSGGEDWGNIYNALDPLTVEYKALFLLFVTFAILALMNVVTAVFVGAAMQRSQNDRELMVQQEIENKDELKFLMQQVFEELDTNNSGALSLDEFEKHIDDERIMAYLRTLEMDVRQVRTLFKLLDTDKTGEVDLDEFVSGCLCLRGSATCMDIAGLRSQVEQLDLTIQDLQMKLGHGPGPAVLWHKAKFCD